LSYFKEVVIKNKEFIVKKDPSDDKFLHCATAGNAGFIITGDKHLMDLGSYGSIKIIPPVQMLKELK
jgi:putative PIN family toxin of toxin-antitoxin system